MFLRTSPFITGGKKGAQKGKQKQRSLISFKKTTIFFYINISWSCVSSALLVVGNINVIFRSKKIIGYNFLSTLFIVVFKLGWKGIPNANVSVCLFIYWIQYSSLIPIFACYYHFFLFFLRWTKECVNGWIPSRHLFYIHSFDFITILYREDKTVSLNNNNNNNKGAKKGKTLKFSKWDYFNVNRRVHWVKDVSTDIRNLSTLL